MIKSLYIESLQIPVMDGLTATKTVRSLKHHVKKILCDYSV